MTKRRGASTSKLKLSKDTSDKLIMLTSRLSFKSRYVICRLAIGRSLKEGKSVRNYQVSDSDGLEFNRSTLTGDHDMLFKALVIQLEQKRMTDEEYFSSYLRKHIEKGITLLYKEYLRINSPVEFLVSLASSASAEA